MSLFYQSSLKTLVNSSWSNAWKETPKKKYLSSWKSNWCTLTRYFYNSLTGSSNNSHHPCKTTRRWKLTWVKSQFSNSHSTMSLKWVSGLMMSAWSISPTLSAGNKWNKASLSKLYRASSRQEKQSTKFKMNPFSSSLWCTSHRVNLLMINLWCKKWSRLAAIMREGVGTRSSFSSRLLTMRNHLKK